MFKIIFRKSAKSFTLIEMIIVIALIVLIMSLAMPFGLDFLQEQRIEEETISLADSFKTAQNRAIAGKNNSAWGIKLDEPEVGQYTLFPLFESDSFDDPGRDTSYDEVFQLSSGAEVTGEDDEIIFEKLTGQPIIE